MRPFLSHRKTLFIPCRGRLPGQVWSGVCACDVDPLPVIEHDIPLRIERQLHRPADHLKFHLVRLVTRPQAEAAGQVATEERLFLDRGDEGFINGLLVLCACGRGLLLLYQLLVYLCQFDSVEKVYLAHLRLLALFEEFFLALLPALLLPREV